MRFDRLFATLIIMVRLFSGAMIGIILVAL